MSNYLYFMKKYLIFLFFILPLCFSQINEVKIEYFVNDYANLLSNEEISSIESVLKDVYDLGLAEYSVVLVKSLNGSDIESFSYNLVEGKLGNKEKNNGLLLLIAVEDRQYRFEVGRGLEPILSDVVMARIGRTYIELNFKKGYYAKGILESSYAIRDILINNPDSDYYKESVMKDGLLEGLIIFTILMIIMVFILIMASKSTKVSKRIDDDYFVAGFVLSNILKGGKGGSFGGGGFGGFGGGSFGGGGSSGRW